SKMFEMQKSTFLYSQSVSQSVSLTIEDFVKRLAKHSLPSRYHRIRNYGFLSNGKKTESIKLICEELGKPYQEPEKETNTSCEICHKGKMLSVALLILDGDVVKLHKKNINRLKSKPAWLKQLEEVQSLNKLLPSLRIFLLSKMFKYPLKG
ncbi:transposase, partial [Candidatus Magnetomorum sp. HK-1]